MNGHSVMPVSNSTSHRLAMRPQIVQVKRYLTHGTSHDWLMIDFIPKKLFGPVAFYQTTHSENLIDMTR